MIAVSAPKNMVSKTADVTTDTPHNSSKHNAVSSLKLSDLLHRPLILYRRYEELIMNTFHAQNMNPAIFPQSMASLCDGLCIQELDEPDLITKILLIWEGKKTGAAGAGISGCVW